MSEGKKKRRFQIGRGVGWIANSTTTDIVECESLKEAQQWSREAALEDLEYWAVEVDEDDNEIESEEEA